MPKHGAAKLLLTVFRGGGGAVNTVAPSHNATSAATVGTAITGTAGTWTGSPTLTYQWYRNAAASTSGGSAIGSATSIDYTPVDADFGYYLYVAEIPNADTGAQVFSNVSGVTVAKAVSQSIGAELLANPSFTGWTGDNPDGWTVSGESGSDPMITEASGAARIYSSATTFAPIIFQSVLAANNYYQASTVCSARVAGSVVSGNNAGGGSGSIAATGTYGFWIRAVDGTFRAAQVGSSVPTDLTLDSASVKLITPSALLDTPSADGELIALFDALTNTTDQQVIFLVFRASNFGSGNFWALRVLLNIGAAFSMNVYSYATHTATSRTSATPAFAAINGLRVVMDGDDIAAYYTINGGTNWTQIGTTVTNALYNTATGCNVIHLSSVTNVGLSYVPI